MIIFYPEEDKDDRVVFIGDNLTFAILKLRN